MQALTQLRKLGSNLLSLGPRRLVALAVTGVSVFVIVALAAYYLGRPAQDVLYAGLEPDDVGRVASALEDAGIDFDVNVTGDAVLVQYGQTAKARMILARKGLPRSDGSGYELFDHIGSLGLTSFMQQVTRVRALEGELARTIQLLDGIKAARVHLALRNDGGFRSKGDQPTASVMIRSEGADAAISAQAIRHLVAAAIPGLAPDQVTVMNTDGTLLASSDDPLSAAPEKLIGLERSLSLDVQQRVARTLAPYLGIDNFRVSVSAKLNADRREVSETSFDPNSRVERSVRTIKESGEAQNANAAPAVSVQQNIPQEVTSPAAGDSSREKKDHREDLTNYEISSKTVATTSDGYQIDRVSVAVIINRASLLQAAGANATAEQLAAQVTEVEQLVGSAAGLDKARGDVIKVTAVDFVVPDEVLEPAAGESFVGLLGEQSTSLINAGVLLLISILVMVLGLRPALKAILAIPAVDPEPSALAAPAPVDFPAIAMAAPPELGGASARIGGPGSRDTPAPDALIEDLTLKLSQSPQHRLAKIVELDPERAASVLKQWLRPNEQTAA